MYNNKENHKGLHTSFCHKCGKWMEFPYEQDGELYHKWCCRQEDISIKIIETEIGHGMGSRI